MAAREKPEPNLDVKAWERWTVAVCGKDEPRRLYRIFIKYAQTSPRSLRVALAEFLGLKGKAARAVRVSGAMYRASKYWSWRRRADEWDAHVAEQERAAFEKARIEARQRRVARLGRLGEKFDAGLATLDLNRMLPNEFVRELVRAHLAEQAELGDRPEDRKGEDRPDHGLPRIEDVIRPPEPSTPDPE